MFLASEQRQLVHPEGCHCVPQLGRWPASPCLLSAGSGKQVDGDKGGSKENQDLVETIQRTLTKPGGTAEGEAENSGNILRVEPQDLLADWRVSPGSWADSTTEFAYLVISSAPPPSKGSMNVCGG